ncbi:MAG: 50S ribosomal protein L13 [Deltaproteobacteria bacterium GWA2_57_13]|uniref:Large ribosomal subunit protein uL13 n=1 Tax=uncultured delta proteobacterium Rifle_16ft_4_minimus_1997 TaxID=1665176 RepID=A0A0H4T4C8_9DELT|nr:50S ribosomal protein L13 [uncultured delta proteobacterium Rifle_16ft_4_minimus_1997]OGP19668.1 MAG: 50S ribosomal protein L13 [Deltaproteobacteria bacterium GWA2_57_13]OGQ52351.1 MAG: 50S ribosomal protein L13 [Deltaproteobacteria bacterium RIFCSPLOWO2_02_FULL_57_26]OGQ76134.1 MAG: 50S ribosomal protein L13 [Deltaproteobacteria bacterium RIFCSPLOWO2_12_FULL_57_22]
MKSKEALSQRQWYVVDAYGKVLGRLASAVAKILRGKHKPGFTAHVDGGDFVIVINARRVKLTGRKLEQKIYYRHTEYPGGIRETAAGKLLEKKPETLIRAAVKGMLPRNRLGRRLVTKLKVYSGPDHPHQAQKPQPLSL